MPVYSSLYARLMPIPLVAEIISDLSLGPQKVNKHKEVSLSLQSYINNLLDSFELGLGEYIRMFLHIRDELRNGWLRQIGGTEEDALRIAHSLVSCTENTLPDGAVCHICKEPIVLEPATAVDSFHAHHTCAVQWVAQLLPTRFDPETIGCPCGCGANVLSIMSPS
mgnify:CR=1 FL=1